ncbi:MAG: glycosyltransferase family 4 protein [Verrucomicrobiota bacterium]
MKILLIHQTYWPHAGGAETCMKQQAELFVAHGHEIRVVTGSGDPSSETYEVITIEEMHPDNELNLKVKKAVDHGQTDASFQEFTGKLTNLIKPHAEWADVIIDHGGLTTHFNLSLTRALWDIAEIRPTIAWAHDFTPTNKSYALPCPDHKPWSLMKTAQPKVTYVAVSSLRQKELCKVLDLSPDTVRMIEPTVDVHDCLGLDPLFLKRLEPWNILDRDIVFYYPTKLLQRKNIDMAFQMVAKVRESGINAMLAVSGAPDPYHSSGPQYRAYLEQQPELLNIQEHACFLSKVFQDPLVGWQQMFRIADVILFPSGYEGFGLPVLEALFHKLPCWSALPPKPIEWPNSHIIQIRTPEEASAQAQKLMDSSSHRERREWLRLHDSKQLHSGKYLPLIQAAITGFDG